ncbi:MAG: glycosyltransferase family 4 protein [Chloroflexi bacterium]|nr:glycosyltransferase family 4 protein [Chloroflexota bacterium]
MKVAINASFLNRPDTGSGQYLTHLAAELRQPEYGIELQLVQPPSDGNFTKLIFEQITFPRAASAGRADLAHVPYWGSALFPRVPTVVTIHDLIPLRLPAYRGSPNVRAYMRLVAQAAARARMVITDSEASQRDIVRLLGLPERKVRVVYLAADERFRPVTDGAVLEAVRQKYRLPDAFALYLGGFDQRKNVLNVVRAFALVAKGLGPDYSLVLAGRLPERKASSDLFPDVRPLINELGLTEYVHLIGEIPEADKAALYTLAHCFVWPSIYEGFGLPVLEAMACGTPVVTSNGGSLAEIVGDAGFAVDPDDVRQLAGAIIPSLIDAGLRQSHREKGLARAADFTWAKCARETVEVYREAVR